MDSLAARGSLPSVGGDCGREGLPASVNVHCYHCFYLNHHYLVMIIINMIIIQEIIRFRDVL